MCCSEGYHSAINVSMQPPHLEFARIGHCGLEIDGIDQWLSQGDILDNRIIKPIYIIPDCNITTSTPLEGTKKLRMMANGHAQLIFSSL